MLFCCYRIMKTSEQKEMECECGIQQGNFEVTRRECWCISDEEHPRARQVRKVAVCGWFKRLFSHIGQQYNLSNSIETSPDRLAKCDQVEAGACDNLSYISHRTGPVEANADFRTEIRKGKSECKRVLIAETEIRPYHGMLHRITGLPKCEFVCGQ